MHVGYLSYFLHGKYTPTIPLSIIGYEGDGTFVHLKCVREAGNKRFQIVHCDGSIICLAILAITPGEPVLRSEAVVSFAYRLPPPDIDYIARAVACYGLIITTSDSNSHMRNLHQLNNKNQLQ